MYNQKVGSKGVLNVADVYNAELKPAAILQSGDDVDRYLRRKIANRSLCRAPQAKGFFKLIKPILLDQEHVDGL